jgi:hypothetical protein
MAKIIYEPHPISPSRKAKLQAQGYKIIDSIFAPAGTPVHQKLDIDDEVAVETPAEPETNLTTDEEVIEEAIVQIETKAKSPYLSAKRGKAHKE